MSWIFMSFINVTNQTSNGCFISDKGWKNISHLITDSATSNGDTILDKGAKNIGHLITDSATKECKTRRPESPRRRVERGPYPAFHYHGCVSAEP